MKNFISKNPMAFALIIVFLLLIIIGVVTSKAATPNVSGDASPSGQRLQQVQPVGSVLPR